MDSLSPAQRSERMSRVRGKDSAPELEVRRLVRVLGFRYRLHRRDLPGTPDLVFSRLRKVIFVHGCFWHRHRCRNGERIPRSRLDFWRPKLAANRARDVRVRRQLGRSGWRALVIWECQLKEHAALSERIKEFLSA